MKTNESSHKSDVDDAPLTPEQVIELRSNTLSTRMKLIIYAELGEKRRFPQLEGMTGIPLNTWRSWWKNGSNPSGALVEAIAKCWPQFAYWLVTSTTDIRCGHDMPRLHAAAKGYISNFPEELTARNKMIKNGYSHEYLKTALELESARDASHITYSVKSASLRLISERRQAEILENFKTKLTFEDEIYL